MREDRRNTVRTTWKLIKNLDSYSEIDAFSLCFIYFDVFTVTSLYFLVFFTVFHLFKYHCFSSLFMYFVLFLLKMNANTLIFNDNYPRLDSENVTYRRERNRWSKFLYSFIGGQTYRNNLVRKPLYAYVGNDSDNVKEISTSCTRIVCFQNKK